MGMALRYRVSALAMSIAVCVSVGAGTQKPEDGTKKLTVHPALQGAGAKELLLLPKPEELTEADAFPLYAKAVSSLPKDLDWEKIKGWRQIPVSQLPQDEVGSVLRQFGASLPLLEQAARCKRCDWPLGVEGEPSISLTTYRGLVFLAALKARSDLARGDYVSCVRTLRTGLALAKHLNEGPSAIYLLVGVAAGAIVYGEIEQYVQQPGAPSLDAAIQAIPKPLFDEKHSDLYGMDATSRSKAQRVVGRANRHVIALQYIETLRLYATKAGRWPQTLDELKASLPNDPVTGKPFAYRRLSDTQAILEGPLPQGGDVRDTVRYELNLAK
jgi:hypothetical protein